MAGRRRNAFTNYFCDVSIMLYNLSLFGTFCKCVVNKFGMFLLTFFVMVISGEASLFIISELDQSHFLGPLASGIDRLFSRIIMAVLPVGRASFDTGPWATQNPLTDLFNSILKPNYNCPIIIDPPTYKIIIGSVMNFLIPISASYIPVFILIHFSVCGLVVGIIGPRLRRKHTALYGCMKDTSKISRFSNLSKILMISAVLSIIWPIISNIIWGTWWEYSVLIYQRYTVILTHDQNGISAGGGINPYGSGVAIGWFGYYGVVAGVFLSYLLTVLWTAKFIINRAVKREAAAAGVGALRSGSADGAVVAGDMVDGDNNDTVLSFNGRRSRRWMWRVGMGLLILMLYGWPLVVGWVGRILPDDIWMKWVPY